MDKTLAKAAGDKIMTLSTSIALIAGMATAIAAFVGFLETNRNELELTIPSRSVELSINEKNELLSVASKYSNLKNEFDSIVSELSSQSSLPPEFEIRILFESLDRRISKLESDLDIVDVIESAIMESPERAMSIPILRRDIDSISDLQAAAINTYKEEVNRIYDLNKWFLGLMGTMAIGVIGLAIGNFRKEAKAN